MMGDRQNAKNLFLPGKVLFIIGRYGFETWQRPRVIEVTVIHFLDHGRNIGMDKNCGQFLFSKKDIGKSVFLSREEAEAALEKMGGGEK